MSDFVLEIKNLKVDFLIDGKKTTAVHEVNLSVKKHETVCVVGESGCGKSVTATALMRLLPKLTSFVDPETVIELDGKDLTKLSDKEFDKIRGNDISMIFQEPMTSLNPVQNIGKQLMEMVRAHRKLSKKEAYQRSVEMLKKVGIPEPERRMKEFPHQLSGGMRQRVMIAMALICEPRILIADEPTTALDVTIQAQILELMNKLKEETDTSIILITHDMGVVAENADFVMVMYAGEIVEYDQVKYIFKNPLHPYTQGLLRSIPRPDQNVERLATIEGTVPTLKNMPQTGCRFADRCPYCREKCRQESPKLRAVKERYVRCHFAEEISGGNV